MGFEQAERYRKCKKHAKTLVKMIKALQEEKNPNQYQIMYLNGMLKLAILRCSKLLEMN